MVAQVDVLENNLDKMILVAKRSLLVIVRTSSQQLLHPHAKYLWREILKIELDSTCKLKFQMQSNMEGNI